jgi:hypothetical protein
MLNDVYGYGLEYYLDLGGLCNEAQIIFTIFEFPNILIEI